MLHIIQYNITYTTKIQTKPNKNMNKTHTYYIDGDHR